MLGLHIDDSFCTCRTNRDPSIGPCEGATSSRVAIDQRGVDLLVVACVVSVFGVSQDCLLKTSRGPARTALARQVAMYLHHVVLGQSHSRIALRFGRDRTTVSHACKSIEERRDQSEFDAVILSIERAIEDGLTHLHSLTEGALP